MVYMSYSYEINYTLKIQANWINHMYSLVISKIISIIIDQKQKVSLCF